MFIFNSRSYKSSKDKPVSLILILALFGNVGYGPLGFADSFSTAEDYSYIPETPVTIPDATSGVLSQEESLPGLLPETPLSSAELSSAEEPTVDLPWEENPISGTRFTFFTHRQNGTVEKYESVDSWTGSRSVDTYDVQGILLRTEEYNPQNQRTSAQTYHLTVIRDREGRLLRRVYRFVRGGPRVRVYHYDVNGRNDWINYFDPNTDSLLFQARLFYSNSGRIEKIVYKNPANQKIRTELYNLTTGKLVTRHDFDPALVGTRKTTRFRLNGRIEWIRLFSGCQLPAGCQLVGQMRPTYDTQGRVARIKFFSPENILIGRQVYTGPNRDWILTVQYDEVTGNISEILRNPSIGPVRILTNLADLYLSEPGDLFSVDRNPGGSGRNELIRKQIAFEISAFLVDETLPERARRGLIVNLFAILQRGNFDFSTLPNFVDLTLRMATKLPETSPMRRAILEEWAKFFDTSDRPELSPFRAFREKLLREDLSEVRHDPWDLFRAVGLTARTEEEKGVVISALGLIGTTRTIFVEFGNLMLEGRGNNGSVSRFLDDWLRDSLEWLRGYPPGLVSHLGIFTAVDFTEPEKCGSTSVASWGGFYGTTALECSTQPDNKMGTFAHELGHLFGDILAGDRPFSSVRLRELAERVFNSEQPEQSFTNYGHTHWRENLAEGERLYREDSETALEEAFDLTERTHIVNRITILLAIMATHYVANGELAVYSNKGAETQSVPVQLNEEGLITSLDLGGFRYSFGYDSSGFIVSLSRQLLG